MTGLILSRPSRDIVVQGQNDERSRLKCTLLSFQRPAPRECSVRQTKSLRLAPEASGCLGYASYPIRSKALQFSSCRLRAARRTAEG